MVAVGYTLLCEQSGPTELIDYAVRAEEAGFDQLLISDHYNPWLTEQGHCPYTWSVLGAVAHATGRIELMTYSTCPIRRYHPAVVAQKAATIGVISQGRFTLGLGAGENLNEHVVGAWPHVAQRHEMFEEAVQIIRPLLDGEVLSFSGNHYEVPEAYLWDRPERPVPMAMAASGPESCRLAGEYADGLIAVQPEPRLGEMFDRAGGAGKPRYGQLAVCYGTDEAHCRQVVYDQWRWFGLGWKVMAELPEPHSFAAASQFVREEDVAASVPCGPDVDAHVAAFKKFVDAGFTHVGLVQVGNGGQREFLDWAGRELLPRLRRL
ncbi:TIGR03557 family F420-dependent LLM class oxidoreductase [Micromonospora sp. NPDC049559]|uniref:TIGR03557 family F420-dependent LLM class oxidoreductase n=1 Tax=Micromonospora sp. NPDC049559 TaxID=3155923 RepID=UPI00343AB949